MLPSYVPGYNVTLPATDWDTISRTLPEDLSQYIADEIAGIEDDHTIYGLTDNEIILILEKVEALHQRLIRAIDLACQGWPKAIHEALDAAD